MNLQTKISVISMDPVNIWKKMQIDSHLIYLGAEIISRAMFGEAGYEEIGKYLDQFQEIIEPLLKEQAQKELTEDIRLDKDEAAER
jgi:hypothetical protein